MAAAIFFVSGGPLGVGALFFCAPRGVGVWGFGFSVGVLRAWGCLGVYTKSQGYRRLVSSPPYEKHDITICIKAYICVVK